MTHPADRPDVPGRLMLAEIEQQPDVLARQLADRLPAARALAARIAAAAPRFVVIAARGSSDHAALYAKYLIEIGLGLPVALASPSTLTVYRARPRLDEVLWIAISQSGGSPDLVEATAVARRCGAFTVAVTNTPGSDLSGTAEHELDLDAGPERSVAATKTYTAQLFALWLLIDAWRGGDASPGRTLPDLAARAMQTPGVDELAQRYRFAQRLVTTGRGLSYPSAAEAALKLMETCYLSAQAFSGADLLHGPLAMLDGGTPVLALLAPDAAGVAMGPVLERLDESGVEVSVVGAGPEAALRLPSDVPPELSPIVEIIPLQRLALTMAVDRQLDPDTPRALRKVTRTW